jgi:hypothetical protein
MGGATRGGANFSSYHVFWKENSATRRRRSGSRYDPGAYMCGRARQPANCGE